jgi:hypothetical protein
VLPLKRETLGRRNFFGREIDEICKARNAANNRKGSRAASALKLARHNLAVLPFGTFA